MPKSELVIIRLRGDLKDSIDLVNQMENTFDETEPYTRLELVQLLQEIVWIGIFRKIVP